jgi:hypothetical protein
MQPFHGSFLRWKNCRGIIPLTLTLSRKGRGKVINLPSLDGRAGVPLLRSIAMGSEEGDANG